MEDFCYHGIGTNLLKYESVLEHGILTKNDSYGITAFNVTGLQTYNGDEYISVVIPHHDFESGAIQNYVFNGISFLITGETYDHSYYYSSYSGIFDEGYVEHSIPTSNLSGIIIPTHLRDQKISNLPVIEGQASGTILASVQSVIDTLVEKGVDPQSFTDIQELAADFNTVFNDDELSFEKSDKQLSTLQTKLDTSLAQRIELYYQQQFGKEDVTLMDVVEFYNKSNIPIYDEKDVKEQCQGYTNNIPYYIRGARSHDRSSIFDSPSSSRPSQFMESLSYNEPENYINYKSNFKKVAKKSKASSMSSVKTNLMAYMNQLHEKHRRLR